MVFKNKYLVKYNRILRRTLIKYSLNPRPGSYPFITGDGFRALADHVYDDRNKIFDPTKVRDRDIVFLGNSHIKEFLTSFHQNISHQYILISHNGDENIDEVVAQMIDEKIIHWFGINVIVKHPKVTPLPLGIENKWLYVNGIPENFTYVQKQKDVVKKDNIFYAFTIKSNEAERRPAFEALRRTKTAETIQSWMTFAPYLELLNTYKFTASPVGSSIEGHRTWDALYINTIPIVTRSVTAEYFKSLGIPVWVIDSWSELEVVTESELANKYVEFMNKADWSKIYMDFWLKKIEEVRDRRD